MMPQLKAWRVTANVPSPLHPAVKKRVVELRYRSESAYIVGLVLRDLIKQQPHMIVAPLLKEPTHIIDEFIERLVREMESPSFDPVKFAGEWLGPIPMAA